jgi:hypothetical protein
VLEILFLVYLCRKLGAILRAKGRSAGGYQFLLVVLWFGGEIFGAVVTVAVLRMDGAPAYLGALLGAAGGATLAFVIANSLGPVVSEGPPGFAVVQPTRIPDRSEL